RKGEEGDLLSLEDLPHDLLFTDLYNKRSDAIQSIQERGSKAQKFRFIIAEYNGSYPGVLKAFIDACSSPASFYHKKAIILGVSSGQYGIIRAVDHFPAVCNYSRMHVLPLKIHSPYIQSELNTDEILVDKATVSCLNEQIDEL